MTPAHEYARAHQPYQGPNIEPELRAAFEAGVASVIPIIEDLTDDEPCWYDHHDLCQKHSLGERPCGNERGLALLATVSTSGTLAPVHEPGNPA